MHKDEIIRFISKSTKCREGERTGAVTLLAEMLGVSKVAVSNYEGLIPPRRAMQLDRIFRSKDKMNKHGLPYVGAPKYDPDLYVDQL